jgi:glycosyltransferase involved in cell wall biosynthesis
MNYNIYCPKMNRYVGQMLTLGYGYDKRLICIRDPDGTEVLKRKKMRYRDYSNPPANRQGRKPALTQSQHDSLPLLSVIVANYNYGAYIRECLEGILGQSFKHLEIIVFDDCSGDDSPRIIREYEEKYPGVVTGIFSPVKRGVARARHEAILKARAEYITTLDSDDYYYDQQKLAKEMALLSHYKESTGKDIIAFSNIALVRDDKSLIRLQGTPGNIKEGKIFKEIITRSCMIPRDFIMKKDAYGEVGGYNSRFLIYEDWDLKIRLAQRYEYYYTGITGIAYRRHGTGLSSLPISENFKWLRKVFNSNIKRVPKAEKKEITSGFKNFVKTSKEIHRKGKRK